MLFKLFRNRDKRDKLPNSSSKSTIRLLPKTDNKSAKKTADENQLSTLLQKMFSKVLVNGIQRYLRRIKRKIDIFSSLGMQEWVHIIHSVGSSWVQPVGSFRLSFECFWKANTKANLAINCWAWEGLKAYQIQWSTTDPSITSHTITPTRSGSHNAKNLSKN